MQRRNTPVVKIYMGAMIVLGWFALITQFYLTVSNRQTSAGEMLFRFFSYFTIQTNLVLAFCYTVLLLAPGTAAGRFFGRQQTIAALTVYIIIVGLIYNTILRFLWSPEGIYRILDEILHTFIPLLAIGFWIMFAGKNRLQWRNIPAWLIYPFLYIIYTLVRGKVSGFYPYPFINTMQLGLNKVVVNSLGIALVFAVMSVVLVMIAKSMTTNKN